LEAPEANPLPFLAAPGVEAGNESDAAVEDGPRMIFCRVLSIDLICSSLSI
jgi:hypothetical protein